MSTKVASANEPILELLRDMFITDLRLAGLSQAAIRQIVGCGIGRVNALCKAVDSGKGKEQAR